MKTTHYDISVDVADLIEDIDSLDELFIESTNPDEDDEACAVSTSSGQARGRRHDDHVAATTSVRRATDGRQDSDLHDAETTTSMRHAGNELAPWTSTAPTRIGDRRDDDNIASPFSRSRQLPPPLPALSLIGEDDLEWVTSLIDIAGACRGQPWRVALERIDGAQYFDSAVAHQKFAAAVSALQRVLSGRNHKAQLARACRELVLGHPALSQVTRTDRIAAAARALEISCDDVERLLWADLPRERPVEFPFGRPSELEVAAFANVQLIQRAVRRAQTITIAVRGDAGPIIRGASTRGLLATVRVAREEDRGVDNRAIDNRAIDNRAIDNHSGARYLDDVTILDIVGPLALCHRTAVYGRAIASLVPLLAECSAFELTLTASGSQGSYRSRVASPVLLPSLPAKATASSSITTRLARDLRRAAPSFEIVVGPPPTLVGETFVCPDIALDRGRLNIEIVGFWTAAYLERKRDAYACAGLDVVFCVDESRGCADDSLPANVMPFSRHIEAAAILGRLARRA